MFKFFSYISLSILLASCAVTPNIKPNESLIANEGIVVTNCKSPGLTPTYILFYPETFEDKGFGSRPPDAKCTEDGILAIIKLEAGNYHVGYTQDISTFKQLPKFNVQPNKVNYIGDVRIAVKQTNIVTGLLVGFDQPQTRVSVLDNRHETLQRLSEERPDIIKQYQIVFDIAK